jgi:PAS domain S-box-containing protein
MTADEPAPPPGTAKRALARLVPLLVVLALVGGAVGAFFVTRRAVQEQNRRALDERAATIEVTLQSTEQSIASSLKVLADVAASNDPAALVTFERVARDQLLTATGVGAARVQGGRIEVVAGVGATRRGEVLEPAVAAVVRRALGAKTFVAAPLKAPPRILLALAVDDVVAFEESSLVSASPQDPAQSAALGGLDIALYASTDERDLVLATAPTPFHGQVARRPIVVGADTWQLVASSRHPLVGTFTERVPWVVLGAGLLAAVLAGAVVNALTRRRAYALRLVAERTTDLEAARQFQESLLTSGPVMVSRTRLPDRQVTYVSPNVERILGVPVDLPGTVTRADRVHADDLGALEEAVERVRTGASAQETLEIRVRTGDGSYRWVCDVVLPDRDPGTGAVVGVLSYVTDIADRKEAEAAMRTAQEAAEAANRAKSEFLSRMSHELRTPMNAVLGFGQLLEQDHLTHDQRESVTYILTAGRHLLGLIDEVLDISRIEAGTLSLSLEPVRADHLIDETLDLVWPMAEARGIRLVHEPPPTDGPYLLADLQRLKQVLLNLLSNAVKYNVERGLVTVTSATTTTGKVRITVTDTGPGISPEQRALLFTPFQRLGAEQGPVEGTGIGLVLSRSLAEAMGGSLDVDTTGPGSRFWVELPAATGELVLSRRDQEHATREAPPATPGTRAFVLCIEDNPSNARLMERVLETRPGLELIVAGQGRLGVELAREHLPRLVLLDLHLPDIGGEEVLRRLRRDPTTADIPVVVVSADGTHGHESRLLEAGAAAFLTKPYDVSRLLSLIDDAVARA